MPTLDCDLKQVLVYHPNDPNGVYYHHRALVKQGPNGQWVGISPTHEIQVVDLAALAQHLVPLRRNAPFPAHIPPNQIFAFDPFADNEEADLREEAQAFGELLGFGDAAPEPVGVGSWYVADTASELFGQVVPEAALGDPALTVVRERSGMANIDGEWIYMQRLVESELDDWRMAKWSGAGRDPRIAGSVSDKSGKRYISESDAMGLWRPPKSKSKDDPLQGPPVTPEYFDGLRVSGRGLVAHDQSWRQRSGIPEFGLAARFHTALCEILRFLVCIDQLDPTNCVSAELLVRYLVMIEAACDRNPKQPDWEGLEVLVNTATTARGAIELPKFNSWVSSLQKDRAVVLKQGRLLREERAAEAKRRAGKKEKGKDDE